MKHRAWYLKLSLWLLMPNNWRLKEVKLLVDLGIYYMMSNMPIWKNLINFKFFTFYSNIVYLYRYTLHLALLYTLIPLPKVLLE